MSPFFIHAVACNLLHRYWCRQRWFSPAFLPAAAHPTNRGNKDAFTWELGEYTLTPALSVQPVISICSQSPSRLRLSLPKQAAENQRLLYRLSPLNWLNINRVQRVTTVISTGASSSNCLRKPLLISGNWWAIPYDSRCRIDYLSLPPSSDVPLRMLLRMIHRIVVMAGAAGCELFSFIRAHSRSASSARLASIFQVYQWSEQ